jgi:signal transduction histidine kinase
MKISVRFALALTLVGLVGSGLQAAIGLARTEDELRSTLEGEALVLGQSLRVAFVHALRDRQLADVTETLRELEAIAPHVDIGLFDREGRLQAETVERGLHPEVRALIASMVPDFAELEEATLTWVELDPAPFVVYFAPLHSDSGQLLGVIVIADEATDLELAAIEARRTTLLSLLVFVAGVAAASLLLGHLSITRPLQQLAEAMQRVRSQSFDERVDVGERDEIGQLAGEFNAMLERLAATQDALDHQRQRRRELEQQLQRLDKLAAVGQLAATLAHEIGSPLQVLVGRAQAIADHDYPPEKVRHHAQRIAEQGSRIAGIIRDLLGYARRQPIEFGEVDLTMAALSVIDLLELEAQARAIELRLRSFESSCMVRGDLGQLQQAIFNLVHNALDASPRESVVSVEIRRLARVATATDTSGTSSAGAWIELCVHDQGEGITSESLPHVTEPFFTTKAKRGGTGLGLSVVKSIVVDHGGELAFESAGGQTRALLRLPAAS